MERLTERDLEIGEARKLVRCRNNARKNNVRKEIRWRLITDVFDGHI
ncbi:MAG: hypothetical protein ACOC5T_07415 [Elusimicrobiota bacterium]